MSKTDTRLLPDDWRARQFLAYHEGHPDVYSSFRKCALRRLARGHFRLSAVPLLEDVRAQTRAGDPTDRPRIRNDFAPYYARLLLAERPDLRAYLHLRPMKSYGADMQDGPTLWEAVPA